MTAGGFDPRLTTYFGDATLQAGFLPLPNLFLRHYDEIGLSGQQAMFVMQIMAVNWDAGRPPVTLSDIASRMGIARRTARSISAELHAQGLIKIYEQYDDAGAQTENAYDLGPLFQRLAAFAPPSMPCGTQRRQRARTHAPEQDVGLAPDDVDTIVAPGKAGRPPRQKSAAPLGKKPPPPPDHTILAPRHISAGLKEESKTLRKNSIKNAQEHQAPIAAEVGRSLRWDQPLSATDVHLSRQLPAKIGINADVADAVAPSLHPAETWALWLHARACRLRPGWIAMQVFDPKKKQPRMAGITAPYEDAGRLLAAQPSVAGILVDVVDRHCPDERAAAESHLKHDPAVKTHDNSWREIFEAVWTVVAQERQPRSVEHGAQPAPPSLAHQVRQGSSKLDPRSAERWADVLAALSEVVQPADYATWILPLVLVHTEDDLIVLGAPNLFVRSEIQHHYLSLLEEATAKIWRKPIAIDVIICAITSI